jgi:hypothetical protein
MGGEVTRSHRRKFFCFRSLAEDLSIEQMVAEGVPAPAMRVQEKSEVGEARARTGGEPQRPHTGERVERSQRRLPVRRLDQRLELRRVRLSRPSSEVLPLGFRQLRRIVVGHLETARQLHEGRGPANLGQRSSFMPGLRSPDNLREIIGVPTDEFHTLERLLATDRPPPLP